MNKVRKGTYEECANGSHSKGDVRVDAEQMSQERKKTITGKSASVFGTKEIIYFKDCGRNRFIVFTELTKPCSQGRMNEGEEKNMN